MEQIIRTYLTQVCGIQSKSIRTGQIQIIIKFYNLWMEHRMIDAEKQVFVPSTELQKLSKSKYITIRNACCIMKGFSNHLSKQCDLIIGWTESFDNLCLTILKCIVSNRRGNGHYTCTIRNSFDVGADTSAYTHTENSQFRWYHNLQNLDKEQKAIVYEGSLDFDIQSCFPQIFHNNMMFAYAPEEYDLMIDQPEVFLQKIIDDKCFTYLVRTKDATPRQKAKMMRSRLFNPPRVGKHQKTGVQWYDNLADWIVETLNNNSVFDAHNHFTRIEQEYVEKAFDVIGRDNIRLRMHDGFISKPVVSIEDTLKRLEEVTSIKWTCKSI